MLHPERMQESNGWLRQRNHRIANHTKLPTLEAAKIRWHSATASRLAVTFNASTGGGDALTTGYYLQPLRGGRAEEKTYR